MFAHTACALGVLAATLAFAGHAAPLGPNAPPPPVPAGTLTTQAQGQVQRLLINPYGEVDGLRLSDGSIVRFAPHLSEAVGAAVRPGDTVRVMGRSGAGGSVRAEAIVNTATGQTVADLPPRPGSGRSTPPHRASAHLPPHLRAQQLQPQQVEGTVDTVLTGPRGEPDGVILADGSIVRFAPDSVRMPLQPGVPFAASGLGTRHAAGISLEALQAGSSLSALLPLADRAP